jgi:hypothetical protein
MPSAKIDFKLGSLSFAGEGDENWLAKQLDKILESARTLAPVVQKNVHETGDDQTGDGDGPLKGTTPGKIGTLAAFLKTKNATKPGQKFLATAEWSHLKGKPTLAAADVVKALRDNHQSRLSNPAVFLSQNIARGYCDKNGDQFFVTDEGRASLH